MSTIYETGFEEGRKGIEIVPRACNVYKGSGEDGLSRRITVLQEEYPATQRGRGDAHILLAIHVTKGDAITCFSGGN